ncbi:MAG: DUF362 domain-containing protein [Chloroflexi bacterium]|nr:MAG: DUF362 domain-containing protein [Chloroflexota bacterium]
MEKPAVAVIPCAGYDQDEVEAAVGRALELLGGMARFVRPGQRVLIKPNLLLPSPPERAIVTHPSVLRAVAGQVQAAGGLAFIADNPVVLPVSRRGWESAYERAGWAAVAAETGARLNTSIVPQQHPHPEGRLLRVVDTSSFLAEADVVISLPKLKSHNFMRFTGAVKNLFGVVPGTVKFGYHLKLQSAERFADMLLDLASFVRPALTVMDGVVGMDGHGPSAGDPFAAGVILAGTDPVALDVAALGVVGHEPLGVPTVAAALRRGLSSGRLADLEILGEELSRVRAGGFRLPPSRRSEVERVPSFLRPLATGQLVASPFVTDRCIGCGLCIENCPAKTIVRLHGRAHIRTSNCIRCYCCHELCPEQAIDLHHPLLARVLARLSR